MEIGQVENLSIAEGDPDKNVYGHSDEARARARELREETGDEETSDV